MLEVFVFAASSDYNVLVYPENQKLLSFMQTYFLTMPYDESIFLDKENDSRIANLKSLGEALNSAYAKEDESAIKEALQKYEVALNESLAFEQNVRQALEQNNGLDYNVKYVSSPSASVLGNDFDIAKVCSQLDLFSMQLLCSTSNADMLVIPLVSQLEGLYHFRIFIYKKAENNIELCYEKLLENTNTYPNDAILSLAPYFFKEEVSVVVFDKMPEGSTVLMDDEPLTLIDGKALVLAGEHIFQISNTGYSTRKFRATIPENSVSALDSHLNIIEYGSIRLESNPASNVYYEGKLLGSTPIVLEGYTIPLVLRFSAEGYSQKTVSISTEKDSISVELKPLWMDDLAIFKEAKDDFYASFAVSLALFGLKIASSTLATGENSSFFNGLGIALDGALVLSLTSLASHLIEYYRCTEYISP